MLHCSGPGPIMISGSSGPKSMNYYWTNLRMLLITQNSLPSGESPLPRAEGRHSTFIPSLWLRRCEGLCSTLSHHLWTGAPCLPSFWATIWGNTEIRVVRKPGSEDGWKEIPTLTSCFQFSRRAIALLPTSSPSPARALTVWGSVDMSFRSWRWWQNIFGSTFPTGESNRSETCRLSFESLSRT